MSRIERLDELIELNIKQLESVRNPCLNDTKMLTEIMKTILTLEQIKSFSSKKGEFEIMSDEDIENKMKEFE